MKIGILTKKLKIHIFDLKYKDYNKYVVESPEIEIRKLLSIRIEREKSVKALKHAKNMFFDQKKCIFSPKSQNAQHGHTCIIRIWIQEVKYV